MLIDPHHIWSDIQAIKNSSPLVHNITNYVVMEHTANSLLAIGASPVMAHALEEAEEMVNIANSLVLNIGTLSPSWVEGMLIALKAANSKGIPIAFDPVGVGATIYRRMASHAILNQGKVSVIRGNASEIVSLCDVQVESKGVDSQIISGDYIKHAKKLALVRECVVWMSGKTDIITDGKMMILVDNGDPLMSRVTGMGCTATAITGAFLAVNSNALLGCAHAAILNGIAGEVAARNCNGPGSFKSAFLDALHATSYEVIEELMKVRIDLNE